MHKNVKNLLNIKSKVKQKLNEDPSFCLPEIIAVSKTFEMNDISPLIEYGHKHFGENKVQEAVEKWSETKNLDKDLKLHLLGKLQTNKVKFALKIFDYIHSLDNEKLAQKISKFQSENSFNVKIFIQVNIGNEDQKSGINEKNLLEFYKYCKDLNLNIIGLMCIPPFDKISSSYFKKMQILRDKVNLNHLSMGMSSDFLSAIEHQSTFLRIGSEIFGKRG
tara:strand:+ start:127 stop:786 length:660 start_codon:yes stop_codon:yes gene_type:complete